LKLTNHFQIKVIPNSKKTQLVEKEGLKLYLKEVPEKGKANLAVIKFFKKEKGLKVEIVKGKKCREKFIKILN